MASEDINKIYEQLIAINQKLGKLESLEAKIDNVMRIVNTHEEKIEKLEQQVNLYKAKAELQQYDSIKAMKWMTAVTSTVMAIFTAINVLIKII